MGTIVDSSEVVVDVEAPIRPTMRAILLHALNVVQDITGRKIVQKSPKVTSQVEFFFTFATVSKMLLSDSYGHGIVDTGCTLTIAGSKWMEHFISKLPTHLQVTNHSVRNVSVVFGDGQKVFATKRVNILVQIGNMACYLAVHVIDGSLPCLISLRSLNLMGAEIDMKHSSVSIADHSEKVRLKILSSGHLAINLESRGDNPNNPNVLFMKNEELAEKEILKLHKQFAHCHTDKLKSLLSQAGHDLPGRKLEKAIAKCQICPLYGRPKNRPVVGLPLATTFNEVAMDLHQISVGKYYIHFIDLFSRFS